MALAVRIYHFYRDGFRAMHLGRTLWSLVLIKLFILFALLKVFFFPDLLHTRYATDAERADHVLDELSGKRRPAARPHHHGG